MVSKITDRILPQVKEWQTRPLNPVYPFVFMDCIHYKVGEDGRILSRAVYVVLGVTVDGYKEIFIRLQGSIQCPNRRIRPCRAGGCQRNMGKEVSLCHQQLGK